MWPHTCVGCGQLGSRVCTTCAPSELEDVDGAIPGIAQGWAVQDYASPLGIVIRQVKYRPDRRLGVALAERTAAACAFYLDPSDIDAVIAVPSTAWTRFRRGFALASLMSHRIGLVLDRPDLDALAVRGRRRQAGLSRRERAQNLNGRVIARRQVPPHVLLVDDVITTGATAEACAMTLLQEGATRVWIVAACLATTNLQTAVQIQ